MVTDCFSGRLQELHVLAVDDSLVDRTVIERLLKISRCKVTVVESGRRALQYLGLDGEKSSVGFDDLKVNLIMTDYSMPEMTGFELLQKIKGCSKLREIPVVIMSSENIVTRVDRCLEEGAERFLVKPVKLSDVQRLKDCILNSAQENNGRETTRKRKFIDDSSCLPAFLAQPATPTLPLNRDNPLSPTSAVSDDTHHLLAKRPSLIVASD